jgi:hypothetical protein
MFARKQLIEQAIPFVSPLQALQKKVSPAPFKINLPFL